MTSNTWMRLRLTLLKIKKKQKRSFKCRLDYKEGSLNERKKSRNRLFIAGTFYWQACYHFQLTDRRQTFGVLRRPSAGVVPRKADGGPQGGVALLIEKAQVFQLGGTGC